MLSEFYKIVKTLLQKCDYFPQIKNKTIGDPPSTPPWPSCPPSSVPSLLLHHHCPDHWGNLVGWVNEQTTNMIFLQQLGEIYLSFIKLYNNKNGWNFTKMLSIKLTEWADDKYKLTDEILQEIWRHFTGTFWEDLMKL